jgi:hypothetical protein
MSDPSNIIFMYEDDVNLTDQWEVTNPSSWHFAGEATLDAPLSGAVG